MIEHHLATEGLVAFLLGNTMAGFKAKACTCAGAGARTGTCANACWGLVLSDTAYENSSSSRRSEDCHRRYVCNCIFISYTIHPDLKRKTRTDKNEFWALHRLEVTASVWGGQHSDAYFCFGSVVSLT